jgi:Sec7-like guanine-nucleotide exchange factor
MSGAPCVMSIKALCLSGAGARGVFKHPDAVYVLAFSTVMLNTDLWSPTMDDSKRMKVEDFISNNRGAEREEGATKRGAPAN